MSQPPQRVDAPPPPQILDGAPLDEQDRRLRTIMAEIETKQLDFLDNAGKSLIERTATLLAVVFAVIAFGEQFPPVYLQAPLAKFLILFALLFYLASMFLAMRAVQPRPYKRFDYNASAMRTELERMVANKVRSVWWAGTLFWLATVLLMGLVVLLVLGA